MPCIIARILPEFDQIEGRFQNLITWRNKALPGADQDTFCKVNKEVRDTIPSR